ncbi:uncharacterized protein [Rutidosis leptorrhynchoides]|uniref:uncharacterized protein n=1 Tax=Rutidosis leptorrhynchoides TaxID=125765 RepID=UPI003A991353
MDFFRSILSDDPDPETLANSENSDTDSHRIQSPIHQSTTENDEDDDSNSNINSSEDGSSVGVGGGVWSFGDLVKTLTTRSESVFETYRRDLQEFGTGLRKESDLFREVASRAVKELPEVGTSAIDGVLKSTADIIAQGKEVLLAPNSDVDDSDASGKRSYSVNDNYNYNDSNSRRYSRFDMQLNAIKSDVRTYCEDPEDVEEYNKWKLGFVVGDKKDEIEKLVGENGSLSGMYAKIVPNEVDDGTFWFRYFYKVYKLEQQEDMRAKLVKRSLSVDDEELSWDVDDDDEEEEEKEEESQQIDQSKSSTSKGEDLQGIGKKESLVDESKTLSSKTVNEEKELNNNVVSVDESNLEEPKSGNGYVSTIDKSESVPKSNETIDSKVESHEIKNNIVAKSDQPSVEEDEDLEWDEIEDIGNDDDKNVSHGDKVELRKRLSTAADEEDLSWDIEDEDDVHTAKSGNK